MKMCNDARPNVSMDSQTDTPYTRLLNFSLCAINYLYISIVDNCYLLIFHVHFVYVS